MSLHEPSGRSLLGVGLAATTMLLWGSLPLALKGALVHLDPVTLTVVRFAVASAVLAVVLARSGRLPRPSAIGATGLLFALAVGGLSANFMGFLLGLDRTSPANAQLVIQLAPLLLGLGGLVVFGERYAPLQWLGVALLVGGLGLFFRAQLAALADALDAYLAGTAWLLFAALTWAVYALAQKQLLLSHGSAGLMCWIYAGCALVLLPGASPAALPGLPAVAWPWVLYCAANTLVGYGAFAAALEHVHATRVSAVLALTPLATLGFSVLASLLAPETFSPEPLGPGHWLGGGLVVAGSLATSLGGRATSASGRPGSPG